MGFFLAHRYKYNMSKFNVFGKYIPAQAYAFDVEFSDILKENKTKNQIEFVDSNFLTDEDRRRLKYAVTKVEMPKFEIEEVKSHFGNFNYSLPIYNPNKLIINIDMQETDDCLITYKFLKYFFNGHVSPIWMNDQNAIRLTISQYDTYKYDMKMENRRNKNRLDGIYLCKLIAFSEPSYNYSESVNAAPVTVRLSFIVINENYYDNIDGVKGVKYPTELSVIPKTEEELLAKLFNLVEQNNLMSYMANDTTVASWKNRFKNQDNISDKKSSLTNAIKSVEKLIAINNELASSGSSYRLKLSSNYGSIFGSHAKTSGHYSGVKIDVAVYDQSGNIVSLKNQTKRDNIIDSLHTSQTLKTDTWGKVEYGAGGSGWIDLQLSNLEKREWKSDKTYSGISRIPYDTSKVKQNSEAYKKTKTVVKEYDGNSD